MTYLSKKKIDKLGFKSYGNNLLISDKAVFYYPETISIGNNVRIDDFCVLVGNVVLHDYIHMAICSCLLSSKDTLIEMHDFSGISYQSLVFTNTDDFSGNYLSNPTVPDKYRNVTSKSVCIEKHCIIGAGSIVCPGADMKEGSALGAKSFLAFPSKPWKIYFGTPALPIKDRENKVLELEKHLNHNNLS